MGKEINDDVASNLVNSKSLQEERTAVCKLLDDAGPDKDVRMAAMQKLVDGSNNKAHEFGKNPEQERVYELGFPGKNQLELVNTRGGAVGHDVVKEKYGFFGFAGKEVMIESSCDNVNKKPRW